MTRTPKPGDHVTWNSTQGEIAGKVEKIVTKTTKVKGHVAHATKDKPEVLVRSDKTGAKAVHKPDALKKA